MKRIPSKRKYQCETCGVHGANDQTCVLVGDRLIAYCPTCVGPVREAQLRVLVFVRNIGSKGIDQVIEHVRACQVML